MANSYLNSLLVRALAALNRSDLVQAERCIDQVLRQEPENPDALQLLGLVRRGQNRPEDAIALYQHSLASNPTQAQVEHNLGNALYDRKKFSDAAAAHTKAIQLKPDYAAAYAGLVAALSAGGSHQRALEVCRQALRIWPKDIVLRQLLGTTFLELRQPDEAIRVLESLSHEKNLDPRTAASLRFNLVLGLHQLGRYREALHMLEADQDEALLIPQFNDEIAQLLFLQHRYREAHEHFLQANLQQPKNARLLASIALSAVHIEDIATARQFSKKALAVDPLNALAMTALACAEFKDKNVPAAIEMVEQIASDFAIDVDDLSYLTLGVLADWLDHAGHYNRSFSIIRARNDRRYHDEAGTLAIRALDEVKQLKQQFIEMPVWPRIEGSPVSPLTPLQHVFVAGFMRSGTTLLATALASQENVVAADEVDLMTDAAGHFLLSSAGLESLKELRSDGLHQWIDSYWKLAKSKGFPTQGKIFVEKMPFNSLRLPLIARLFPNATILFAIRDPRDVILSCMRQNFEFTPFSFELLRLEDCATFYSEVMSLVEIYREKLPLKLMPVRYEDLIHDYSGSMKKICSFCNIEWRDSVAKFSSSTDFVNPRSASVIQVKKELYTSAAGKWRHYKTQLAPAFRALKPWISKLGYPEN